MLKYWLTSFLICEHATKETNVSDTQLFGTLALFFLSTMKNEKQIEYSLACKSLLNFVFLFAIRCYNANAFCVQYFCQITAQIDYHIGLVCIPQCAVEKDGLLQKQNTNGRQEYLLVEFYYWFQRLTILISFPTLCLIAYRTIREEVDSKQRSFR